MTTSDHDRDFLRTLADAATVEGVRLDKDDGRRVLDRFNADFAAILGGCSCCQPDPTTAERVERLRGQA